MTAIRDFIVAPLDALPHSRARLVIARIHEELQRHLEHFGHFFRIHLEVETFLHETHNRLDAKAGSRFIGIKRTEDLDMRP